MGDYPSSKYSGPSYMATDAENQNNAVGTGADNSINDPNWNKTKYKKIKDFVPNTKMARAKYADKAPKIDIRKSYSE
jgi:hypothetical protein